MCTTDACSEPNGCVFKANAIGCDDGNKCTGNGKCAAGKCAPGVASVNCSTPFECRATKCNPTSGSCEETVRANGTQCLGSAGKCEQGWCRRITSGYFQYWIPPSDFWMGCNPSVGDTHACLAASKPQHKVYLSGYWMDVNEVDVTAYKGCVSAGKCSKPAARIVGHKSRGYCTYDYNGSHPVNCVTPAQAQQYCAYRGGSLPTEAQWERAARGGCDIFGDAGCAKSMRRYPGGNSSTFVGCSYVRRKGCWSGWPTSLVWGQAIAEARSLYGMRNMSGNVWEWVLDRYDSGYYNKSKNATNPFNNAGTNSVFRGGSFLDSYQGVELGNRNQGSPATQSHAIGFRCAAKAP